MLQYFYGKSNILDDKNDDLVLLDFVIVNMSIKSDKFENAAFEKY